MVGSKEVVVAPLRGCCEAPLVVTESFPAVQAAVATAIATTAARSVTYTPTGRQASS